MVTIDGDIIKVEYAPVARFMRDVSPIIRRQLEDIVTGANADRHYEDGYTQACSDLLEDLKDELNNKVEAHKLTHKQIIELVEKLIADL